MPREHADIKNTPEELRGFLSSDTRLILATIDKDDRRGPKPRPTLHRRPLHFRVPTKSRSYEHIVSDGRVCCVVESKPTGSSYYAIKGPMMHGTAQELSPGEGPEVHAQLLDAADPVTGGRNEESVVYSVGLDDSTSFVFTNPLPLPGPLAVISKTSSSRSAPFVSGWPRVTARVVSAGRAGLPPPSGAESLPPRSDPCPEMLC